LQYTKLLQALFLLAATLLAITALPLAEAATPTLKVTSSSVVATGTSLTINVKIQHFGPAFAFDFFQISVKTDPTVLNPTKATLGPLVSTWTVFQNCVDGVGTACGINDGGGVVSVAAATSNGVPVFSHGPKVLFSITYTAVNSAPSTTMNVTFAQLLHAGTPVSFIIINGSYS
jgi:hypothetical protein